ncbi:MAG: sensor histidine kinase [Oculatellaceae cyanobacterium bins.114]|nr:sensor histidine kinase [Oculatellaceae cyanobacterium bins.114]
MKQSIPIYRDPQRLMSSLEWVLLGIAVLNAILPSPFNPPPNEVSILNLLVIVGFAGVGLLPRPHQPIRVTLLTALEFGLMWLPILLGQSISLSPALHVIVVIRSCLMCRLPGRLLTAGITLVSFLMMLWLHLQSFPPMPQLIAPEQLRYTILAASLNISFSFGLTLLFILLLINALLSERQSREELAIAHEQLQHYALQIESQATLQERTRIAREIHDSLGHSLTAQMIQLENVLLFWQSDTTQAKTFLLEAKRLSFTALQDVRQAIAALRADPLRGKSPETAIARLIQQFHQTTGLMPTCMIEGLAQLPSELGSSIYRILQEALTNVAKHSEANQVMIVLQIKADVLHLIVEDNGKGFDPLQNTSGFGLQGMRERTSALGGQFNTLSEPGQGCRVTAYIPLSGGSHDSSIVSRRSTPHPSRVKKLAQRQFRLASRRRCRKWSTSDRPS